MFFLRLTMRFDLLFVSRRRFLMPFDPAARVFSSAIKRSYAQHATQASPNAENSSLPPSKRPRHRDSGAPSPFSSPHSTSKYLEPATRLNNIKSNNLKSNNLKSLKSRPSTSSSPISSKRKKKKKAVLKQQRTPLPGPHHNEAYIEKEHNKSVVPLKHSHKDTPKSSVNNFYQQLHGRMPKYTSIEGEIVDGKKQIYTFR